MPTHNTLERVGVAVATTDATLTAAATFATRTNEAYMVTARVIATETVDYDETAGYIIHATFRNDGGTLTLVGAVSATHTAETTGAWVCTLAVSGTDIVCNVTGAAATVVTWKVALDILAVGWKTEQTLNAP